MNQPLRRSSILLITLVMFTFLSLDARDIEVNPQAKTKLELLTNTYNLLKVKNEISVIHSFKVRTEEGIFIQLQLPGYSYSEEVGAPKLPMLRKLIEVPENAVPEIRISYSDITTIDLDELGISEQLFPAQIPATKDGAIPDFEIDQTIYNTNAFSGREIASVEMLGHMRGLRLGRLDISPIDYNPYTNTIRVYENLEVEVVFSGADIQATYTQKMKNQTPYYKSVGRNILNYKAIADNTRDTIAKYPIKYVIVSDPMFETQLQTFIEWKTKKGFTVVEAYTDDPNVGTSTTSIKAYLEGLYNAGTTADPAPSFILFVGDVNQIPAFNGNAGSHITDLFYCEYTNDYFPEVYWGRFSAQDAADLQPQIDKTLQVEQYTMPDPSYLNDVLLVSGMDGSFAQDWGNGQINYGTINYFNAAHGITPHVYLYPESGSHSSEIIQHVSDGVGFGNYTAHCNQNGWGDPSFTVGDVAGLQNQDEYGLLVGNCCLSNAFDSGECFGEALLRAENKGAVAYIGGTNNTMWDPDYFWGVGVGVINENPPPYEETTMGAYDGAFHDHGEPWEDWYTTSYQMTFAGNLAVTQGTPGSAEYYWEIYCVMGDPSLEAYFSVPSAPVVTHDPLMPLGVTTFTVNAEPYSYVAISMNGILHGAVLADATGLAVVQLDPITIPGTADIVCSKQNFQPYIGTVLVNNPNGPYVMLSDVAVDDAAGNNDGKVDCGESINLDVELENLGNADANNVEATLSTADQYITITNDSGQWGLVATAATSLLDDAFSFDVADYVPDQHLVDFDVEISGDAKEVWNSSFSIIVNAPELMAGSVSVDDSQSGNGNGMLDPGETADIIISVDNAGHSEALDANSTLISTSPEITVNTASVSSGNIPEGGNVNVIFNVSVSSIVTSGTSVNFEFDIAAGLYTADKNFFLVVGQIPVLVVDLDQNTNSADKLMDCCNNLNVGADYVTAFPADLYKYASIFVCLGIYSDNHVLSSAEGQGLADYLDGGGKLYMEGGDTWYYDDPSPVHPYFNINGLEDGSGDLSTLNGQDGTFTEGMNYTYSGDNNWIDHIAAVPPAFEIFKNQSPQYTTAVAFDAGGYRTIGSAFEFGGLADGQFTKDELMIEYLEFFQVGGFVGIDDASQANLGINIYPNPAKDIMHLNISVSGIENVNAGIYNSTGQKIMDVATDLSVNMNYESEINLANISPGIYYFIIKTNTQQQSHKLVILK
ncbi:C25 family cysteine peptidase [Bacteroidota bacterium]